MPRELLASSEKGAGALLGSSRVLKLLLISMRITRQMGILNRCPITQELACTAGVICCKAAGTLHTPL